MGKWIDFLNMANYLTGLRIVCSFILLFLPSLSMQFFIVYGVAGMTDILDGMIARKFGLASEKGARFDTIADACFVCVVLIKIMPLLQLPSWIYIWVMSIALIKLLNIILGFVKLKKMIVEHTIMNKLTGIAMFLFPFVLLFAEVRAILILPIALALIILLCMIATFSAIQEGYYVWKGRVFS